MALALITYLTCGWKQASRLLAELFDTGICTGRAPETMSILFLRPLTSALSTRLTSAEVQRMDTRRSIATYGYSMLFWQLNLSPQTGDVITLFGREEPEFAFGDSMTARSLQMTVSHSTAFSASILHFAYLKLDVHRLQLTVW